MLNGGNSYASTTLMHHDETWHSEGFNWPPVKPKPAQEGAGEKSASRLKEREREEATENGTGRDGEVGEESARVV